MADEGGEKWAELVSAEGGPEPEIGVVAGMGEERMTMRSGTGGGGGGGGGEWRRRGGVLVEEARPEGNAEVQTFLED